MGLVKKFKKILISFLLLIIFFKFNEYIFWDNTNVINEAQMLKDQTIEEFYTNPYENVCQPSKPPFIIAFVVLAPEYFEKRKEIRETWGNNFMYPNDFQLVFSVGFSNNSKVNTEILEEFSIHKDILLINNYNDSYFTMTSKIMASFKWISIYCNKSSYILRLNDDVVVNTFHLIEYFKKISYKKQQLFGNLQQSKIISY